MADKAHGQAKPAEKPKEPEKKPEAKAEQKPKPEKKSAALTILPGRYDDQGRYGIYELTLGGSYPAGGYELDPAAFGRAVIEDVVAASDEMILAWDGKLHCKYEAADEAKRGDDLSRVKCRALVIGPPA